MPGRRPANIGERVAAIDARFEAFEKYSHQKWHDLGNDLQPVVLLPAQIARVFAQLQGHVDGKIGIFTKEIERSIEAAVEKAIAPVSDRVAALESKVDSLEDARQRQAGIAGLLRHPITGGFLGGLIALAAVAWAWLTGRPTP